jgi:hypothetical protein
LKWIPLLVTYLATLKCYLLAWFWRWQVVNIDKDKFRDV